MRDIIFKQSRDSRLRGMMETSPRVRGKSPKWTQAPLLMHGGGVKSCLARYTPHREEQGGNSGSLYKSTPHTHAHTHIHTKTSV